MATGNDIRGDALTVLGSMFNVDSHKSITVEGLKLNISTLIEFSCRSKFSRYNYFNTKVHPEDFIFNPFLKVIIS
jgi:hypothetical protein